MISRMFMLFPALAALTASPSLAQEGALPAPQVREAMAKLGWMKGEWDGTGWRVTPQGREDFAAHELVEPQVEGLVLLLHGRGWALHEDGSIGEEAGHLALGVLSYDAFRRTYVFDSYVKEGYQVRGNPAVGDNEFRWSHPAGPGVEMKYHARLTDDGEWLETGERCEAEACSLFLEMRLKKIGAE
ncbi:hypothetical protein [Hyphococcus sp.]|uniref:hypothetical protein n=1 Tax=Hyphococcus sp. TaxID=2038636 RepID=UPI003D0CCA7F